MSGPKDKIPPNTPSAKGGADATGFSGQSDERLETDVADLSRVYGRLTQDEPPQALDDAVRAAARRAVHSRPQPMRRSWIQRWTGPVSVAALVVLTVSIGLVSVDEKPEIVPPPIQRVIKPRVAVPADVREEPLQGDIQRNSSALRADEKAGGIGSNRQPAVSSPATAPDAEIAVSPLEKKALRAPAARQPTPFVADPDAKREAYKPQASPPSAPDKQPAEVMELRTKSKAADATVIADAPAETTSGSVEPRAASVAPPHPALQAKTRSEATAAPAADMESPEAWVKRILTLHREGNVKEVEEELAKFKRRYPEYHLPAELKGIR